MENYLPMENFALKPTSLVMDDDYMIIWFG